MITHCANNPVMYVDPSGEKWTVLKTLYCFEMVVGVLMIASGVLTPLGGVLLSTSAGAMIGGLTNENNGGSFEAGAAGGAIIGLFLGIAGVVGGTFFAAAASGASNAVVLNSVAAGIGVSFASGAFGGMFGSFTTQYLNGNGINGRDVLDSGLKYVTLGIFMGYLGSMVNVLSSVNSGGMSIYSGLAGFIAFSAEGVIDGAAHVMDKIRNLSLNEG